VKNDARRSRQGSFDQQTGPFGGIQGLLIFPQRSRLYHASCGGMAMNVLALIPARYASTRLPGKPLFSRTGRPLIQHVYEQVRRASRVRRCVVATDDERIATAVRSFGGEARLTRSDHASGTDRIAEVVAAIPGQPNDIVLNVQGDEPEIEPAYLDRLVERLLASPSCPAATLACPFPSTSGTSRAPLKGQAGALSHSESAAGLESHADPRDPNCVKVVCNRRGEALYFSRSLIPCPRDGPSSGADFDSSPYRLHIGVYGYRRWFLLELAALSPSPLERIEKLEQLRILENGHALAVELVERAAAGIDTPQDYEQFVRRWQERNPKGCERSA
jgi:3-deoxy-manno-octulosonate cytidylyltransferase (CMP-KDO synthetase)